MLELNSVIAPTFMKFSGFLLPSSAPNPLPRLQETPLPPGREIPSLKTLLRCFCVTKLPPCALACFTLGTGDEAWEAHVFPVYPALALDMLLDSGSGNEPSQLSFLPSLHKRKSPQVAGPLPVLSSTKGRLVAVSNSIARLPSPSEETLK